MFRFPKSFSTWTGAGLLLLAAALGFSARDFFLSSHGQTPTPTSPRRTATKLLPDTAGAFAPDWEKPYPQYQPVGKVLQPCPDLKAGEICPQDLYVYGGAGKTSLASIEDVGNFDAFYKMCSENKPKVNAQRAQHMDQRYHFSGRVTADATMTRGKPLPVGPVVRLPEGVKNWQELDRISPEEIRRSNMFPLGFRTLSH